MRTIKEELMWLRERSSPHEVATAISGWIERYNNSYLHSTLKSTTPNQADLKSVSLPWF